MNRCKGFTLIEILLVMLITSVLVLGVHASYRQARLIWASAEGRRPIYHKARLITETLREELSCLYSPPGRQGNSGVFELFYMPDGTTELSFCTTTTSWRGSPESSRIARVRYQFIRDGDTDQTVLQRLEQLYAGETPIGQEVVNLLATDLLEFRVLAFDPNSSASASSWSESYSGKETPPKAVRVLMKWIGKPDVGEVGFEAGILIPCEGALGTDQGDSDTGPGPAPPSE